MSHPTGYNFEEAIHGVLETKVALERAQAAVARLEQLLTETPRYFQPVAEPAFRLRDRLIEDLETLEVQLSKASAAAHSGAEPPGDGPRDVDPRDHGVPIEDAVNLGAQ